MGGPLKPDFGLSGSSDGALVCALFFLPITKRGCPILALFARVGSDAADAFRLIPRLLGRSLYPLPPPLGLLESKT